MAAAADRRPKVRTIHYFISGSIAGTASRTFIAPYDRVRILLQLGRATNLWTAFRGIYVNDGIVGYFRGNLINCVRAFWTKGLLFGLNDTFKGVVAQLFAKWDMDRRSVAFSFLSGSLAGSSTQLITYPLDVVRTRVSGLFGKTRYKGFTQTLFIMIREEGITSLYKGVTPTLWGGIAYEGVKFCAFDVCLDWCHRLQDEGRVSQQVNLSPIAGAMAGIIAIGTTHPNDTVRRRMQMAGSKESTIRYRHTLDAYQQILRREGVRAFYRGLESALLRTVPGTAIQFGIYHGLKKGFASNAERQ
eukprot:GGOE01054215.1.p1 GENE.GGOE01054215.1~~GGOE01054215.1.p1  ORF type:complete len:302 (+),score=85.57 GGOE01054215.1:81-986(+)